MVQNYTMIWDIRLNKHTTSPEYHSNIHNIKTSLIILQKKKNLKSPRILPGFEASGFVSPSIERACFTTSIPSQTIATTGPDPMYLIRPMKISLFSFTYRMKFQRTSKERFVRQLRIMLLQQLFTWNDHF